MNDYNLNTIENENEIKMFFKKNNINEDTREPSGFVRHNVETMGIIEFSYDGTVIHKIDNNGIYSTNNSGNFANGTQFEEVATPMSFVIYPSSDYYCFYVSGKKYFGYELKKLEIVGNGTIYIYFDINGNIGFDIEHSFSFHSYKTIIAYLYINASNVIIFQDERHGIQMDDATHMYNHFTFGTRYVNGLEINGLVNNGTTFTNITKGMAFDEDITINSDLITQAPFMYSGNDGKWVIESSKSNVIPYKTGTYAMYNRDNLNGTFSLVELGSNEFTAVLFVLTNNGINKITKLVGRKKFTGISNAKITIKTCLEGLFLNNLPSPEFLPLFAVLVNRTGQIQTLDNGTLIYDFRKDRFKS